MRVRTCLSDCCHCAGTYMHTCVLTIIYHTIATPNRVHSCFRGGAGWSKVDMCYFDTFMFAPTSYMI